MHYTTEPEVWFTSARLWLYVSFFSIVANFGGSWGGGGRGQRKDEMYHFAQVVQKFYFVWSVATSCLFTGIVYVYKCFSFDFEMQRVPLWIMISVCL